jgi:hypothetical protein
MVEGVAFAFCMPGRLAWHVCCVPVLDAVLFCWQIIAGNRKEGSGGASSWLFLCASLFDALDEIAIFELVRGRGRRGRRGQGGQGGQGRQGNGGGWEAGEGWGVVKVMNVAMLDQNCSAPGL